MIVSGLASIGGLTLLYVAGFAALVTSDPHLLAGPRPILIVAVLTTLTVGAVLIGRRWLREPTPASRPPAVSSAAPSTRPATAGGPVRPCEPATGSPRCCSWPSTGWPTCSA